MTTLPSSRSFSLKTLVKHQARMYSKTELQLKDPERRKGCIETCDGKIKTDKREPDLKKTVSGECTTDENALFKNGWDITALRETTEMLQYRGKRSCGSWCDSELSSLSRSHEYERTESVTSGFFSRSDHSLSDMERKNKTKSAIMEKHEEDQFEAGLKPPGQDFPVFDEKRYCWYCFEVYKAMCSAQGRAVPSTHSDDMWRGHCSKDENGVTTCPHLWFVRCQHCGASAEQAHTARFCPTPQLFNLSIHNN